MPALRIAFIVGKTSDYYRYKVTSKHAELWLKEMAIDHRFQDSIIVSDEHYENNMVPSDVAMAMWIAYHHPRTKITLIDGTDFTQITQDDLDAHDVVFVIYDPIEVFHSGACRRRTCPDLAHKAEKMLEQTTAYVYPHIDFHKYIITKPKYYADLERSGVPVAPFIEVTPDEVIRDVKGFRERLAEKGLKGVIVKPSYAGYSKGIRIFKDITRTKDSTIVKHFNKLKKYGFPSAVAQQFVTSFGKHHEIRTYWINEKYACSIGTLTRAVDGGDGLPIDGYEYFEMDGGKIPDEILKKLKPIAKRAIRSVLQYDIKHPMVRVDFGCCLDKSEDGCDETYFVNEVETFAANLLSEHTDYPIVENLAKAVYNFAKRVKGRERPTGRKSSLKRNSVVACKNRLKRRSSSKLRIAPIHPPPQQNQMKYLNSNKRIGIDRWMSSVNRSKSENLDVFEDEQNQTHSQ